MIHGIDKKLVCAVACALLLTGCGAGSDRPATSQTTSVTDVIEQQTKQNTQDASSDAGLGTNFKPDDKPAFETVDYDLTTMNADMIYATVSDMINEPSKYKGKTMRVKGPCRHAHSDEFQSDYYAILIKDATACCSQGFEFVWGDGSHQWPADYPTEDTEVIATGTFDTYKEGDHTYCHLVGASLQQA